MKSFYSKSPFLLLLTFTLTLTTILQAQNTTCSLGGPQCQSIIQDFNGGDGSFTSSASPGAPSFVHNPGIDGDMRVLTTQPATAYTLTSPQYLLGTPGVAFMGFALQGGVSYAISGTIRVAILSASGTELASCDLPNTIEAACVQFVDPDLTPQPVRYQITITTNSGPAGIGSYLAFDDFSIGIAQAPLPVELRSFNVRRNNTAVNLQWETVTEVNVAGFEIQSKTATGSFVTIGVVASKAIGGNSTTPLTYSFSDLNNNNSGVVQYRIKMVDLDARSKYSLIRTVDGLKEDAKILIYPNPSAPGPVNIVFPNTDIRNIVVADMMGKVHYTWKGYRQQDLTIRKLVTGTYLVRITNGSNNTNEVYRITITR